MPTNDYDVSCLTFSLLLRLPETYNISSKANLT